MAKVTADMIRRIIARRTAPMDSTVGDPPAPKPGTEAAGRRYRGRAFAYLTALAEEALPAKGVPQKKVNEFVRTFGRNVYDGSLTEEGVYAYITEQLEDALVQWAKKYGLAEDELEGAKKKIQMAERLIPRTIRQKLRKAFTPKGLPFFLFYIELKKMELGVFPVPDDIRQRFTRLTNRLNQVTSPIDKRELSPVIVNMLAMARPVVMSLLNRLMNNSERPILWRKLNEVLVPIIVEAARDKQVYLKTIQKGRARWARFRKMSPKQEKIEKLRDDDPESFALMEQKGKTLERMHKETATRIRRGGQKYKQGFFLGRPVDIGIDKVTGEERIYDLDGDVLTHDDYKDKRRAAQDAKRRLEAVPRRTQVPLAQLRALSDEQIEELEGDSEWVSLTDDQAKRGRLTRLFPTKVKYTEEVDEFGVPTTMAVKVVTAGRYKGCLIDDLVNSEGRLIEGTEYKYNPRSARATKIDHIDPASREPYVSVADVIVRRNGKPRKEKKLFISISGDSEFRELQHMMRSMASNASANKQYLGEREPGNSISTIRWADQAKLERKLHQLIEAAKAAGDKKAVNSAKAQLKFIQSHAGKDRKDWSNTDKGIFKTRNKALSGYFKDHKIVGSNQMGFYFEPKDFALVRDALDGMSMSKAALSKIKTYFKDLALAEKATAKENLQPYDMDHIGGFVRRKKTDKEGNVIVDPVTGEPERYDLLTKQKQALAWLDASGNRGVCALETGVGKTLTSIGMMQKLLRDGMLDEGASYTDGDGREVTTNGRFLFVCPKDLKGNITKEVVGFLSAEASTSLNGRLDVLSYTQMSGALNPKKRTKSGPAKTAKKADKFGIPAAIKNVRAWKDQGYWDPTQYVAVFFDEAHRMRNPNSNLTKRVRNFWHPRKVLLTASPMEKNPMDAYVLAAIANNHEVSRASSLEMRRFKSRFCESLGGRVIGIKKDPDTIRDLHTWVKSNVFHADKTAVEEYVLPQLNEDPVVVEMPEEVEGVYRDMTNQFSKMMSAMVTKFRDKGKLPDRVVTDPESGEITKRIPQGMSESDAKDMERIFGRAFKPVVSLLNELSNDPGRAYRTMADMMERGGVLDSKGELKPIPPMLKKLMAKWSQQFTIEELRSKAATMPNPKLDAATERVSAKMAETEGAARTLLFSDDKKLCMTAGQHMAKTVPGRHCIALSTSIHLFRGSKEITEIKLRIPAEVFRKLIPDPEKRAEAMAATDGVTVHKFPFTKRPARRYPELPSDGGKYNKHYQKKDWQVFVLKELISADPSIKTLTLHGQTYQYGHNLQKFSTVIHLDRNTWNNESMKQRTARSWRQGQENPVDEIVIDSTYSARGQDGERAHGDTDKTLDEIRAYFNELEGELFDRIIKDAQSIELGAEWAEMQKKDASFLKLDKQVFELIMSPYVERSKAPGRK